LDLATIEPCLAGPSRPQARVRLKDVKKSFLEALPTLQVKGKAKPIPVVQIAQEVAEGSPDRKPLQPTVGANLDDIGVAEPVASAKTAAKLQDGSVVIAAITSCTNTS